MNHLYDILIYGSAILAVGAIVIVLGMAYRAGGKITDGEIRDLQRKLR